MNKYILLFRGINVGGRHLLPMKDLSVLLTGFGYKDIKTYIQSGNVVLQSASKPTDTVSDKIEKEFGFKPQLLVLDHSQLKTAAMNNPYNSDQGKNIHFFFLADKPSVNFEKLESLAVPSEAFHLETGVFYLHAPDGIGRSKLAGQIEKCMGTSVTARNLNTVTKLLEMVNN